MAWRYNNNNDDGDEESVTKHDLRQTWTELVSIILKQILIAKQQNNFPAFYDLLFDLYDEIQQKLKKEQIQEYNQRLKIMQEQISQYPLAFNKRNSNADEIRFIKRTLSEHYNFLRRCMEKNKMFGAKEEAELI
jgi:hypothetical protein